MTDGPNSSTFPGTDWETASPQSVGLDPDGLKRALDYLAREAGGCGVDETVVIRDGNLVWEGSRTDRVHSIDSGTKTFTTTVLGLLCQDGKLKPGDSIANHVPAIVDKYPEYADITLAHLGTMTSGYDGERGEPTDERPWGNPEQYLDPATPLFPAGSAYKYHDPGVHLLGHILTQVSGQSLADTYRQRIADAIGMAGWHWADYGIVDGILYNNPSGIYHGGVHISARQMARHGLLHLNRGNWNGRQLIDSAWVDLATTNQVPVSLDTQWFDLRGHYGYMWWTNGVDATGHRPWPSAPDRTYTSVGASRNYCFVIPEWRMVVVRMEDSTPIRRGRTDTVLDGFFERLGGSLA